MLFRSEDPLGYVYNVLKCSNTTRPTATEAEKVDKLFDELPISMKAEFVNSMPTTVAQFE